MFFYIIEIDFCIIFIILKILFFCNEIMIPAAEKDLEKDAQPWRAFRDVRYGRL